MIRCLAGIDLHIIDKSHEAFREYLHEIIGGLLLEFPHMVAYTFPNWNLQPNRIYELHTPIGLQSMVLLNPDVNQLIILGPSLMENYTEASIRQTLSHFSLSKNTVQKLINQCASLPMVSTNQLYQACILLNRYLIGSDVAVTHQVVNLELEYKELQQTPQQGELLRMRQVETRYERSNTLTEAVKQGNLSMAMRIFSKYNPGLDNDTRNENPLRNFQNYCIVLNTQLRHALENSGIHPYLLDKLSNQIGLEIENTRSMNHYKDFIFSVLQRYCQLVQENSYPNLKSLVHLTVTYIKEHLDEDLTVKDTAKVLGVNANYLSTQFHAETGLTFIDFIHRERAAQAAALLKHSNLQIQQIASMVGYNNASYFTKQFFHFYEMTPSTYRTKGKL